ncbi:CRISPR-associated helicase Cas3' [Neisseria sp. ZJ106]|uniref:CRISPR-associated helicase Cas3 n=1 Tax=Neisseria lisongii TaxID=2912188 RepID=A0ABY7RM40_9NEIS|nr:CRISPR-associated helicase Cas3' [Neisseria lisongii]MCF7521446.1 CRISPR-associated helicase Cas3' [Neisseria lisongii]WCL72303.1 CRISPR-associated helicase Cas3' [Neisseria lisongii]
MKSAYIAHVRKSDKVEQTLFTHLTETAQIASALTAKLNLDAAGELLGLMHDFGKYSKVFQKYIMAVTGFDPDADDYVLPNGKKIDHSTAGAQWVYRQLSTCNPNFGELFGQILGLCIASHHGAGLIDCLDSDGENIWGKRLIDKADEETHLTECLMNADQEIIEQAEALIQPAAKQLYQTFKDILKEHHQKLDSRQINEFYLGCFTRFLFSCLIDADRINSADFECEQQKGIRTLTQKTDWHSAIEQLEYHLKQFEIRYPIDKIRQQISDGCLKRGQTDEQNIYTLTVPTGGGKTLASLRYALHHAQKHSLDRIIYIIPYTSIIDQNAQAVRNILGEDWVLEHHSNLDPEKQTWQNKLLSENWDKPIVFTTMVQFLDAWFAGGTRGVRHLHAMTRSVLIFDEIQTLPIKCTYLFCHVLNWLVQFGKSSVILCTATQPVLDKLPHSKFNGLRLPDNAEIMENVSELFNQLKRVDVQFNKKTQGWSVEEAGSFLLQQFERYSSCLFIVNTKRWAKDLYRYCQNNQIDQEALFHLSTNQCAAHRKAILDTIRQRLQQNQPVLCISTQLIEAGVDISMKCVIRSLAGLDSIAQAAGRCNRHGELGQENKGVVWVLNLQNERLQNTLPEIFEAQQQASRKEFEQVDVLLPEYLQQYFKYYFYQRADEMVYPLAEYKDNLFNWLSNNERNMTRYSYKEKQFPLLLRQSFKSAGQKFNVIDAPTRAVIVPYGKGKDLIGRLCSEWNPKEMRETLAKAQRYSVNVFPNIFNRLLHDEKIREIADTGIYYVDLVGENCYSDEYGLSVDEVGLMDFLCH